MGLLTDLVDTGTNAVGFDLPEWADLSIASVVGALLLFTVVLSSGGIYTFIFRRVFAFMGQRKGPNRVGPQGVLQFLADGIKLFSKEDIKPAKADPFAWRAAVYVAVVPTVMMWAPIPWSGDVLFSNAGTGILLILAIGAIAPLSEIMAGWGSNNKYSLYGGVRAAALDVSYEIPLVISVASVLLLTGSLDTRDIVTAQAGMWFILPQILGFVIFFITAMAKAGIAPTDLAESESELVAGFHTEYSGMRFGMLQVVTFSNIVFIAAMSTLLFLGGWQAPFGSMLPVLDSFLGPVTPVFWFAAKTVAVTFLVMWVWVTMPRVRVDQYLGAAWKIMLPLALANFVLTAVLIKLGVFA